MSMFKNKNMKQILSDSRRTLDSKHQEIINKMKNERKTINSKLKELKQLQNQYSELDKKKISELTDEELSKKFKLRDTIKNLKNDIKKIENYDNEKDYFLKTSHLLFEYYNTTKEQDKQEKKENKTIINFFNNSSNNDKNEGKITNYINKKTDFQKAEILDEYLSLVDDNYVKKCDKEQLATKLCNYCNIEKTIIQNEGLMVCQKCGDIEFTIIDSEKPSYKDPPPETSYFAYKRINHFNEWLAQFQAKETTDIPQTVIDKIFLEIKKERIVNMADLTQNKVREYLKKLKLNKYYEHVPHIINRLNGLSPPVMDRETEEKLRIMFKEIQGPFMKVCPKERKNFLSYSYVLHKFVELLGLDEFLQCFPLLKSREKLHQQDLIWKEICKDLKWEFIKSI